MTLDEIHDLVAYTEWATATLAAALRGIPDAARRRRDDSAFGSLHGTFTHLIAAEWVWVERWHGRPAPAPPAWVGEASFDELLVHLAAVEAARAAYLGALTPADLARPIQYRTFAGVEAANPIGELVRHVVNHGTYHRGQISMRIRQLGDHPPSTDYIVWLRLPDRALRARRA
jgi:uncharacterized damage-inducible protein DinB